MSSIAAGGRAAGAFLVFLRFPPGALVSPFLGWKAASIRPRRWASLEKASNLAGGCTLACFFPGG